MYIVSEASQFYLVGSGYTIYLISLSLPALCSALTIRNAECDCLKLKKKVMSSDFHNVCFVKAFFFCVIIGPSECEDIDDVTKRFNEFE